ncbi:soluble calcium-activated nucleotidase 1-like [Pollicipes pollicipes]|uniref:soluble calcium-activated nucleotidase 1-like n=1 Tax=Pollicipes pollicipes TaxID=41117 RepID=UPI001884AC36|nr:soluble calcium-activated nucleotidase 1-like [Pollicipes pollicipes]
MAMGLCECNTTYPLTRPVATKTGGVRYRVAVISDLDTGSRRGAAWVSVLRRGWLSWDERRRAADVWWDGDDVTLTSSLAQGGRGMELSELVVFDGHLLSVDDRTGVVYRLTSGQAVPWLILADGDGAVAKGFKGEWMAVKDEHLYIGGLGKEWTTTTGEVLNHNPQFVKRVSCGGGVEHLDWQPVYQRLMAAAGLVAPGYLIHEAAAWSQRLRQWVFLPRRASSERYDDLADERRGTNLLLRADAQFADVQA